jgi:outer membrane murein-binding lipoprotein Lpp
MSMNVEAVTPENAPRDPAKLAELKRFQQARIVEEVAEKLAAGGHEGDVWAKLVATQETENRNSGALKSAFLTADANLRAELVVEALALFDQTFGTAAAASASKKRPAPPPVAAPTPVEVAPPTEVKNGSRKAPAKAPAVPPQVAAGAPPSSAAVEALAGEVRALAGEVSQLREELRNTIGGLQTGVNTTAGALEILQSTLQVVMGFTAFILENGVKVKVEEAAPELQELNDKIAAVLGSSEAPAEDEGK